MLKEEISPLYILGQPGMDMDGVILAPHESFVNYGHILIKAFVNTKCKDYFM